MWVSPGEHKIVGEILAEARKQQGISQDELALLLGKPQSFISAFENGQRRVDVREFMRIAEGIGLDPVDLFRQITLRR